MSYREKIIGQYHTMADEIFDDDAIIKYEAGDEYFVELYNQINKILPERLHTLEVFSRPSFDF
jgi:hypothetical protein